MAGMKFSARFRIATATYWRGIVVWVLPSLAFGCASPQSLSSPALTSALGVGRAATASATSVEHRFEVRPYQDPLNSTLRHDGHAIFRRTRVPAVWSAQNAAEPRTTFPPASFSPLPISEELAAEIATQKAITTDLRSIQASVIETERKVQAQFAALVRQSAETLKLREQLEAERSRVRSASQTVVPPTPTSATSEKAPEVKW